MTTIKITEPGLVLLVGPSGSGKSTFAAKHFADHEVVSIDHCRALVSGDENDQSATAPAVEVAEKIIEARLKRRLLTVVDATNLRVEDRMRWIAVADRTHTMATAIILDPGVSACHANAKARAERPYHPKGLEHQFQLLNRDRKKFGKAQGYRGSYELGSREAIDDAVIVRERTYNDLRHVTDGLDVIGDVHGMVGELEALLETLGWTLEWSGEGVTRRARLSHPEGRKLVFVGDLCDKGPRSIDAMLIARAAVEDGVGYAVAGNHDARVSRWLRGNAVSSMGGIETTQAEYEGRSEDDRRSMGNFLDTLPAHLVFDGGKFAVAHAGLEEDMILGASKAMRQFAVYGPKTPPDAEGKSERVDWAADYKGKTAIAYGHVPHEEAVWFNNTICLDTGAVHGGKLTALRWPEKEIVSVDAARSWFESDKPIVSRREKRGHLELTIADISGKKAVETRLMRRVTVDAMQMGTAMELLSRFTIDPRLLVYLPPTMSPVETSKRPGYLEHPDEAFAYYRSCGLDRVVVETKHMGSRAHILVCRDAETARARFHVEDGNIGQVWTRNGNPFFREPERRAVLERLAVAAEPLFDRMLSDWLLLDAEIMPWNAKAAGLIRDQYAPTGKAAVVGSSLAEEALKRFASRGVADVSAELSRFGRKTNNALSFDRVWRGYSWPQQGLEGLKIAPFHVLASEGRAHVDASHGDHIGWIELMDGRDPIVAMTDFREVFLDDQVSMDLAIADWERETAAGAEGIVVKPRTFNVGIGRDLIQPALKVRGKDYLRIIYGVDYDMPENIERLRERAIKSKRARALKEHALGVEALERLVRQEPLRRVHECVAAILGLEGDPSDPRL